MPSRPDEWEQPADGVTVKPLLRSTPGQVIGPGHNSAVRGPDNRQLFCVYHRWSQAVNDRVLAVDRLDWAGDRMLVMGPSHTLQPAPIGPTFSDYFERATASGLGDGWQCPSGRWRVEDRRARQRQPDGETEARCRMAAPYFTAEVSLRIDDERKREAAAGIKLMGESQPALFFMLVPEKRRAVVTAQIGGTWEQHVLSLPFRFDSGAFYLLRVEVNGLHVAVEVAGAAHRWEGRLSRQSCSVSLVTWQTGAAFAGFALTQGWEDLFMEEDADPASWGWHMRPAAEWRLNRGQLCCSDPRGGHSIITKGPLPAEYELVINARLVSRQEPDAGYGFLPAVSADGDGLLFRVVNLRSDWGLCYHERGRRQTLPLPAGFDPFEYQQFRFRRQAGQLFVQYEGQLLAELDVAPFSPAARTARVAQAARAIGLYVNRAAAAFDLVRVTALASGEAG
jgi:hypothetical protein